MTLRVAVWGAAGAVAAVAGAATFAAGGGERAAGALAGAGAVAVGVTVATWARRAFPPEDRVEERHAPGGAGGDGEPCGGCGQPARSPGRRWVLAGGLAAAAVALLAPLLAVETRAERRLRRTAWRPGARVVTREGRPVRPGDLGVGSLLTVWPEGAVGAADAQVVLLRLDPARMASRPGREDWAPDGHVAYSKLCTHMGCPVGLYQQDPEVLVCPCHQAVFDVFDAARPVHGPARRPLPQLPLTVGPDGFLAARSDFHEPVGPGWWERPR